MGAFKLGKMTFGSLFKKPETVLYPFEQKPQPAGLKGHIAIDAEACILCGMCDRSCSTDCITVDKKERYWQIDRYACVQCGYCVTVCPKKCLHMHPEYAAAATTRNAERIMIPEKKSTADAPKAEKPQQASAGKPADSKPSAKVQPEPMTQPAQVGERSDADSQMEALLKLMEPDKAEKVRNVLGAGD